MFDTVGLGCACVDFLGVVPYMPGLDEEIQMLAASRQGGGEVATALVALALLGVVFVVPARLHAEEPAEPNQPPATYEVGAQVLTRVLADGRIEFCLQPTVGHVVCPEQRFLPAGQPGANRWLNSSEVSWVVPVDPERVLRSVSAPPPVSSDLEACIPDFTRMLATAWRVETGSSRGTA